MAGNRAGTRRGRTLNAAFLAGLKVPGSSEQKAGWQRHYPRSKTARRCLVAVQFVPDSPLERGLYIKDPGET